MGGAMDLVASAEKYYCGNDAYQSERGVEIIISLYIAINRDPLRKKDRHRSGSSRRYRERLQIAGKSARNFY